MTRTAGPGPSGEGLPILFVKRAVSFSASVLSHMCNLCVSDKYVICVSRTSFSARQPLVYIFKYPQPGQWERIYNPSIGSAREEDIAIAMSQFLYLKALPMNLCE